MANQIVHENYFLGRWDYTVSDKDSIFLRYVLDKQYLLDPFPPSGSLLPLWPETDLQPANDSIVLEWRRANRFSHYRQYGSDSASRVRTLPHLM